MKYSQSTRETRTISMTQPRILITRSPHQSSDLAERLRASGIEPILIPTIEIVEPTTFAPLDTAISNLNTFHWLLFTSANAVEATSKRLLALKGTGFSPSAKVATIGPATTRAAEAAGLPVDLTAPQAVAESLTAALLPYALQPDGTPTRFLLIRAEQARDHLPDTLRAAYQSELQAWLQSVETQAKARGIHYSRMTTATPYDQALERYLTARQ